MAQSVSEFMGKDHDRLDGLYQSFKIIKQEDLKKAQAVFVEFRSGLERHIGWEEEILFPSFEGRTGMFEAGPTVVMRYEHKQIKDYLKQIQDQIDKENNQTEDLEKSLMNVLTTHNYKEEAILYPWIDTSLSAADCQQMLAKMK